MKKWLENALLPIVAATIIRMLAATLRIRLQDPHGLLKSLPDGPVIFSFWHNRLLLMPSFYQFFFSKRRAAALISRSKDGEIISNICARFRIKTVRGSSSKKGMLAFRELIRLLEQDKTDVVITPDGPRGPRYQLQLGVLQLSQNTGMPIIPATYHLSSKWTLRSWDQFQIPKPFSLCHLVVGEPFVVPKETEDLTPYATRLSAAMQAD